MEALLQMKKLDIETLKRASEGMVKAGRWSHREPWIRLSRLQNAGV